MPQFWDRISLLKNVQMNGNKAGIGFCYPVLAIYTGDIMKITYINHSGFLVETRDCYYIFDYYEGE